MRKACDEIFENKHFYGVILSSIEKCSFVNCVFANCNFDEFDEIDRCDFRGCAFVDCIFKNTKFTNVVWHGCTFAECYFEKIACGIDGTLLERNYLCTCVDREFYSSRGVVRAKVKQEIDSLCAAANHTVFYLGYGQVFVDEYGKSLGEFFDHVTDEDYASLGTFVSDVLCKHGTLMLYRVMMLPDPQKDIISWLLSANIWPEELTSYLAMDTKTPSVNRMTRSEVENMKYLPISIEFQKHDDRCTVILYFTETRIARTKTKRKNKPRKDD